MNLVLFATAWGPKLGGINAFNEDFAAGLSEVLGGRGNVYCVVPHCPKTDAAAAAARGVELISLGKSVGPFSRFDEDWVRSLSRWFREQNRPIPQGWWVGHDVISGDIALAAAEEFGGSTALIHHMSYGAYQVVKTSASQEADEKARRQERLFAHPGARLFAVGPLLQQSCQSLAGSTDVVALIPGFPTFAVRASSQDRFISAITFGRLDKLDDRIKQGRLAAAGFARSIRVAYEKGEPSALQAPEMHFVGLEDPRDEEAIRSLVLAEADQAVNIKILPYDEDRASLHGRLLRANAALVLSWHEGFGLTGWEAIAAEVPLIVSKNSGVYQLLHQALGADVDHLVLGLRIRGPALPAADFHPGDVDLVTDRILQVGRDIRERRRLAVRLRNDLEAQFGCTWKDTARAFLDGLGDGGSPGAPPAPPAPTQPVVPVGNKDAPPAERFSIPLAVAFAFTDEGRLTVAGRADDPIGQELENGFIPDVFVPLTELAIELKAQLETGNRPYPELLRQVDEYISALGETGSSGDPVRLYVVGDALASTLRATELAAGTSDVPDLEGKIAASANALVMTHHTYILSTKLGRQLSEEMAVYRADAWDIAPVERASRTLLAALEGHPDIVTEGVTLALRDAVDRLREEPTSRSLSINTILNLLMALLRAALGDVPGRGLLAELFFGVLDRQKGARPARISVDVSAGAETSLMRSKILDVLGDNKGLISLVAKATGQTWLRYIVNLLP